LSDKEEAEWSPIGSAWHILWWFGVCGTRRNPISGASETSHPSQVSKRF
jgi:hypothetical protein